VLDPILNSWSDASRWLEVNPWVAMLDLLLTKYPEISVVVMI
jgi:hypothetical protein